MKYTIAIPDVPPSLNRLSNHGRGGRMKAHRLKKNLERQFAKALTREKVPQNLKRVEAHVSCRFGTRHKRDRDNFAPYAFKALGDALQIAGCLSNDDSAHYVLGGFDIEPEAGPMRTTVTLKVWR